MIDDDDELSKAASAFTAAIIKMYHDDIFNTVWNEAIEAAVKVAQKERHNIEMVDEIRKLKKDVTD